MKELIHRGIFYSREGVKWEVRILREQAHAPGTVGELMLAGDEPLVIEWDERGKEEPICGSTATLKVISPGDRTYIDLYTEEPGGIMLDVLKQDQLYWSGTLDPEMYEEPYAMLDSYEVQLTFSDLGILDRLSYDLGGMVTLGQLVEYALDRCALNVGGVDTSMVSTSLDGANPMQLGELSVMSDNFYDEDGDGATLKEVLEGVLQPLALKLVQRGGRIWIYDLNGLYERGTESQVEWMSDDQVLGVDRVYNNAKVTWSPYVKSGNLGDTECFVKDTDANETALNKAEGKTSGDCRLWTYHSTTDLDQWTDTADTGFTLWTATEGKNATLLDTKLRYFKIVPQEDGEDSEGVALMWPGCSINNDEHQPVCNQYGIAATLSQIQGALPYDGAEHVGPALWKSGAVSLPPIETAEGLRLHVTLPMLMDSRFNPFEDAAALGAYRQDTYCDRWRSRGNFVYVPVTIKFQPDGSDTIYCWANQQAVRSYERRRNTTQLGTTLGGWGTFDPATEADPTVFGYLAWYSASDRAEDTGVLGWQPNRPAINNHSEALSVSLKAMDGGQWMRLPPEVSKGGKLWLEVRSRGWLLADNDEDLTDGCNDSHRLWSDAKVTPWCLMKLPEVEVRKAQTYDSELDTEDVEYKAVLNKDAREDIELETICGTAAGGIALARGAYYKSSDLTQVETLTRAGRTAQAEELLIGTLYSQFASRRTKLTGTTRIGPAGIRLWREAMQGTALFVVTGCTEDAQADEAEMTLVELRPDEYDKK